MERSHLEIMKTVQQMYTKATRLMISNRSSWGSHIVYVESPGGIVRIMIDSGGAPVSMRRRVSSIDQDMLARLHISLSVYDLEPSDPESRYYMTSSVFTGRVTT